MSKKDFHVLIWQEWEYYVAKILENDVSSFGKTFDEAFENIKEALGLYYEWEEMNTPYTAIRKPSLINYSFSYA